MAIRLMAVKSQNTYNMMHEINGEDICFGQIVDTREGRMFYIDGADAGFSNYPAFEAAYYATFTERKEASND